MQKTIFGNDSAKPLVRRGGSAASRAGAVHAASGLGETQQRLLEAFRSLGEATAEEAATWCFEKYKDKSQSNYRRRLKAVVDGGWIEPGQRRECKVTKFKSSQTYRPIK